MVAIAQLAERLVVVLKVAGSSPVSHPTFFPSPRDDDGRRGDGVVVGDVSFDVTLPRLKVFECLHSVPLRNPSKSHLGRRVHPNTCVGQKSGLRCADSAPFDDDDLGRSDRPTCPRRTADPIPCREMSGEPRTDRSNDVIDHTIASLNKSAPARVNIVEMNDRCTERLCNFIGEGCLAGAAPSVNEDDVWCGVRLHCSTTPLRP